MHQLISEPIAGTIKVDRKKLEAIIKYFEGRKLIISFEQFDAEKTSQQLAYYWAGIVAPSAKHLGYDTPEELHEVLKKHFNAKESFDFTTGEVIYLPKSTRKLGKHGFSEYVDRCIRLLVKQGCTILRPEEYYDRISPQPGQETTDVTEGESKDLPY